MQGTSHKGFAVAGAMSINSIIYAVHPLPLHNDWELAIHTIPYTYHAFVTFWQHPAVLLSPDVLQGFLYKLTFYLTLIACASWPDSWEWRTLEDGTKELRFSHRGPTHSIVMLILILLSFGLVYMLTMRYIDLNKVSISPMLLREFCAVGIGVFLAFFLHILADMLTWRGVKVLWPAEKEFGIPPIRQMRPTNESAGEYIWLWGVIFVTGSLFALGVVGI